MSDRELPGDGRRFLPWFCGVVARALLPIVVAGGLLVVRHLLMPLGYGSGPAQNKTQCRHSLNMIGLALWNYHDQHGAFPPACTFDEKGQPLHSWRTLILPHLEEAALYRKIDLSKPWNDPANRVAYATDVAAYRCRESRAPVGFTRYLAVVDGQTCLQPGVPRPKKEIQDGTTNTLMVMEVADDQAVHWMSPVDMDRAQCLRSLPTAATIHRGAAHVLLGDNSVRSVTRSMRTETLRALTTIAGQEATGHVWQDR